MKFIRKNGRVVPIRERDSGNVVVLTKSDSGLDPAKVKRNRRLATAGLGLVGAGGFTHGFGVTQEVLENHNARSYAMRAVAVARQHPAGMQSLEFKILKDAARSSMKAAIAGKRIGRVGAGLLLTGVGSMMAMGNLNRKGKSLYPSKEKK